MRTLKQAFDHYLHRYRLHRYLKDIPSMVRSIRAKDKIKVLFVVTDLTLWKTEELYCAMLEHPRFQPVIGLTFRLNFFPSQNARILERTKSYLDKKGYNYVEMNNYYIDNYIHPDIIFYDEPYKNGIDQTLWYDKNKDSLFCYIPYGFYSLNSEWSYNQEMLDYCWQRYFENRISYEACTRISKQNKNSAVITGIPFQDTLMMPKESYIDPWRKCDRQKKRIIYAPHHSIGTNNYLGYSTFLENGDLILQLAKKYSDYTQWTFKPHPVLYTRLLELWGKTRTDNYYREWSEMQNGQMQEGDYMGLFKYSDAMIHDCCSFQIEYLYTLNPVMYLVRNADETAHKATLNEFGTRAFDLHYKGVNAEDIENFIKNIISGEDPMLTERIKFYNEALLPPYGKKASENIINSILGIAEYEHIE